MSVTATDDASGDSNESQSTASTSLEQGYVAIAHEAAPTVTVQTVAHNGLLASGYTAGQALFTYTVNADADGSVMTTTVTDSVPGTHPAYFVLNNGLVVLTAEGAAYLNSHEPTELNSVSVSVTATDDAGDGGHESQATATATLSAVRVQAIAQNGLVEGGFSAGQALFTYLFSADTDGSQMSHTVSDSVSGANSAYFALSDGQIVLTTAGATYFNSHEAALLRAISVTVTAIDDAGEGDEESQASASTSLAQGNVAIAHEAAPAVTVQAIAQNGLAEGGFTTGQALFTYSVSADTDGSTLTVVVSDNVPGTHPQYFALSNGQIVLTAAGATYFNSHDAEDLRAISVRVTATDDASEGGNESHSSASTSLAEGFVPIAHEGAPTVAVQPIAQNGLAEGSLTAGLALFSYTVGADTDGSVIATAVSDNIPGTHPAYFALSNGQIVLTTAGATYFNSQGAMDPQSVQLTVTATDDANGGGYESQTTVTTTLAAAGVTTAGEPGPVLTLQAISQPGLTEGGFSAGQALFTYSVSADTDGSSISTAVSDSIAGTHPAYFALSGGHVVLTAEGAAYFNSHEAADLRAISVSVTATDDASEGGNESQSTVSTSLASGNVSIASEAAPVVTVQPIAQDGLVAHGFVAGQALFTYTVSADADGSSMSSAVTDNIAGPHPAYFALNEGQVVLTTEGAAYFNLHEAVDLSSVQVTVTATDDAGGGGHESQSSATASFAAVTLQAITQNGLVEGGFTAGQALFTYTVLADTDGSVITTTVSDNVSDPHPAYFALSNGQIVLTTAGATYFNSHDALELRSLQVTVTATDDASGFVNESQTSATTTLAAAGVTIANEPAPVVTLQAISQTGLTEGGFFEGQALFTYTVSADTDGSALALSVYDEVPGAHPAYFALSNGQVVLTTEGADYFNSHEAAGLQSMQVTLTATDDPLGGGYESLASASTSLALGYVAIATEPAPVVTVQAISQGGLIEGGFAAGQALFNYSVSADADGSRISTVVSDNVPGTHPAYFALSNGHVILTTTGATYFNTHEAADLQSVQVTVTATDDASDGGSEGQSSASMSLAQGFVSIASEAAPVVTVQPIAQNGLVEGGFTAGQALFSYTVSADTDASLMSVVVSDNIAGPHSAYFALNNGQIVLTTVGATYFNSPDALDLSSVQVTVTATDDAGDGGNESQASASASFAAVTVQAIAQNGLVEGGFAAGQALFTYTIGADTNGSTQTLSLADNVYGTHPAYFELQGGQIVLTPAGAIYFNSHEAADLRSVEVTVTVTDDAGEGGYDSRSAASTSLAQGHVTIASEAAPVVTVQPIAQTGLVADGFTAGQALFTYTVSADADGSVITTTVSDSVPGAHPAYFALSDGQIVLTTAGATYFNSQGALDLQSVQVTVTASDDADGGGNESQASATATIPAVTVQAIAQNGLVEGGFAAGQALFTYTVSGDTDGSTQTLSVSDGLAGNHPAFFALSEGQVVLTTAGASYFNTHDALELRSLQVTITATDDASGEGNEGQWTASTSLAQGNVSIAHEAAPVVTVQSISQSGLVEGGFTTGQALFNYTVSADPDGSTISTVVSDNVAGNHPAYFALQGGQVVLTSAGATYFNSLEAADLQSIEVRVVATDDAGHPDEGQGAASATLATVSIANEGPPVLTLHAVADLHLVEGGFSAGQQLFSYAVTGDHDASVMTMSLTGQNAAYFSIDAQSRTITLTSAGAAHFNTLEAADISAVSVSVVATDDAGDASEQSVTASIALADETVVIASEPAPVVNVQAIAQSGLVEGGFTTGQALFNYSVSADTDGSSITLDVYDNINVIHPAYFALDHGQVVLTSAGASYFNSQEAADLLGIAVTVTATDDVTEAWHESQSSGTATLAAGNVSIAHESPPIVTLHAVASGGFVEGGFSAGQALFTFSVSADTDGSTISLVVNDDIAGTHAPLYALQGNEVVLTTAGAAYFNSHEAAELQALQVSVSAVDDLNGAHAETYSTTTSTLASLTIAHEAAPTVSVEAIGQSGLREGGFSAGQALFNYTVSADGDASTVSLAVSDSLEAPHSAYFAIQGSQIALTAAGAAYFNSHEAEDLRSITVSLTATDDAGESAESQGSASATLQYVVIAREPAPVVTVSAIQQSGLVEEGFTPNQALFNYSVSGDSDGSTISLTVADNVAGTHPAYFTLSQGHVILTAEGAAYFNTLEASAIQGVQVTVTAIDDVSLSGESRGSASASLASIAVAPEPAPIVTLESASLDGFTAGSFTAGEAILNYAVSGDTDGSSVLVSVIGTNANLFSVDAQNHQIVLTNTGANRLNSNGIPAIEALSISVTARDDAVGESFESSTTLTKTLLSAGVIINIDAPPSLTMSAIAQDGLSEGHFTAGQALFSYVLGRDGDGSVITMGVDDNIVALHSPYFAIQGTDVVLTTAGAAYFNTQDSAALQAIQVSVTAIDDAGAHPENETSATADLSHIAIAAESAPTVSVAPVAHPVFQEGAFTTGMALFDYSVSADADGSTVSVAVSDDVAGAHQPYFALQSGQVVLTAVGASYFNSHEAAGLQAIQVTVTATDDAGAPDEAQGTASSTLHGVTISPEAAPVVTLAALPLSGLIEGGFSAGQSLYSYTVSADHDGSTIGLSVSDNAPVNELGVHPAYFTLNNGQVQLTSDGADYFNTHDGTSLSALQVTVTASDDAGRSTEVSGSATTSLAAGGVGIGAEPPVTVTLQSINQEGLQEGAFSAGQALFSYSVSADSDASAISLRVAGDNQSTYHVGSQDAAITVHDMFSIDTQNHALVLTTLGAEYFNSTEAQTLQALTVDLIATDDAGSPSPSESESVGRADLSHVSIAFESPPSLSLQPIAQTLYEGNFTAGEAIFSFSVSADTDGSTLSYSISGVGDQTFWGPGESVINVWDMFSVDTQHNTLVLTDVGAQYLNSQEGYNIQTLQLGLTVSDQESDSYAGQASATASLAGVTISSDAEAVQFAAQSIDGNALTEGQFAAGQALFHYTVSDLDGSHIYVSPTGDNAAYFSIDSESQNVVLTQEGADYFNTHEVADIRAMSVTLLGLDDISDFGVEVSQRAGFVLGDLLGTITPNETVQVTLSHADGILKEAAFSAGQAIFAYSASDSDGSALEFGITGDNAGYFSVDAQHNTVVLTDRGATYFNAHEAADILALQLGVTTREDDASSLWTVTLGNVISIAPEDPPTVTTQYVTPTRGGYLTGQTLYTFSVLGVDSDGSRIDVSVSDNFNYSSHPAYFAVSGGDIVLTEAGAAEMNGLSPVLLAYLNIGLTVSDDGDEVATRLSLPALGPGGGNLGPVALDLNGDGIQYVGLNAGVHYDYSGTGAAVDTAWVAPQDGVLAYKGADGTTQVVFSTTAGQTDLQGLEQVYDANHDGVLNSSDPTFANFGVVQIAGAGATPTFSTLASLGVTGISLSSSGQISTAASGDVVVYGQTTYTLVDGTKLAAADVAFATTPIDTHSSTASVAGTTATNANPATSESANAAHASVVLTPVTVTAASILTTAAALTTGSAFAAVAGAATDAHSALAALPLAAGGSIADSHAATAAADPLAIDLTGVTYHVSPNLPAPEAGAAVNALMVSGDSGVTSVSSPGSSWVDLINASSAQGGIVTAAQPDAHAATSALDSVSHPADWVAVINTATGDGQAASAGTTTSDVNSLVALPPIAPADPLLHDSTTAALNPWHA